MMSAQESQSPSSPSSSYCPSPTSAQRARTARNGRNSRGRSFDFSKNLLRPLRKPSLTPPGSTLCHQSSAHQMLSGLLYLSKSPPIVSTRSAPAILRRTYASSSLSSMSILPTAMLHLHLLPLPPLMLARTHSASSCVIYQSSPSPFPFPTPTALGAHPSQQPMTLPLLNSSPPTSLGMIPTTTVALPRQQTSTGPTLHSRQPMFPSQHTPLTPVAVPPPHQCLLT